MDISKLLNNKSTIIIIIIICEFLFVGFLFPISYPTDIFNYYNLGLKDYSFKWFLPSGRIVGMIALYILDYLHISINGYIIFMKILALFLATISIFLFYDLIINHTHKNLAKHRHLVLLFSLVIFLNHGSYQYFYYPESGIMWLRIIVYHFSFENKYY